MYSTEVDLGDQGFEMCTKPICPIQRFPLVAFLVAITQVTIIDVKICGCKCEVNSFVVNLLAGEQSPKLFTTAAINENVVVDVVAKFCAQSQP